jgi:hypothetical protein
MMWEQAAQERAFLLPAAAADPEHEKHRGTEGAMRVKGRGRHAA